MDDGELKIEEGELKIGKWLLKMDDELLKIGDELLKIGTWLLKPPFSGLSLENTLFQHRFFKQISQIPNF